MKQNDKTTQGNHEHKTRTNKSKTTKTKNLKKQLNIKHKQ